MKTASGGGGVGEYRRGGGVGRVVRDLRKTTFRDGQRRRPLGAQDVQTNASVAVDVRVVDPGREVHLQSTNTVNAEHKSKS